MRYLKCTLFVLFIRLLQSYNLEQGHKPTNFQQLVDEM